MKRLVTITLVAVLACAMAFVLAACGQQGGGSSSSASAEGSSSASASSEASESSSGAAAAQFATLGDVFNADTENLVTTYDEKSFICAFLLDGTWWRVEAPFESGMYEKVEKLFLKDQDKVEELLSSLKVSKAEALDAPTDEELDELVGKTGAELSADGFTFIAGGVVAGDKETDCTATKGSFDYIISFDGVVADENTDDPASAVADMKVTYAELQGVTLDVLEGSQQ